MDHGLALQTAAQRYHNPLNVLGRHVVLAGQLAKEELGTVGAEMRKQRWQLLGGSLIHAEHIDRFRVVAHQERIACRAEPQALLAEGKLEVLQVEHGVGIEQAKLIKRRNG